MRIRYPLIVSGLLIAAMLAVSVWGWSLVPAGARITTHWDAMGRPNGFMRKEIGLLLLPAIGTAIAALMSIIPLIEPRRQNLIASRKLYISAWIGSLAVVAIVHAVTVMNAAGMNVSVGPVVLTSVCLLMTVLGNFLGKSRSTFMVGVRLPWTLTSEYAWQKSNRLTGLFMMAASIVTLPILFLFSLKAALIVFAAGMFTGVLAGAVASYFYWRNDPNRQTGDLAQE